MGTKTTNYGFTKDDNNEFYDIAKVNSNLDKIDEEMKKIDNKASNVVALVSSVNTKTGDVVLSASDIKTSSGITIDKQLADIVKLKSNITISAAAWTQNTTSQLWEYKITDADISSTTMVDVNIHLSYLGKSESLKAVTQSFNGYVLLYASDKPVENIVADMKLIRQVI